MNIKEVLLEKRGSCYLKEVSLNLLYGFLCGYFFYNTPVMTGMLLIISVAIGHIRGRKRYRKEKKDKDEEDFFEFLIELAERLDSGRNMVNAIDGAKEEIPEGRVKASLDELTKRIGLNYGMDEAFMKISTHFNSSLIINWCRMISLSYQKGSDLQKAIRENRDLFILKKRTSKEVRTVLAKQRLNLLIIKFMPFAILTILISSASQFSQVLYERNGRIVMSIALLLIITAECIAERIIKL